MTETSTPETAERTRADDGAIIALVTYGAVFWGWVQSMDLFTLAVGELFL